jgi:predicted RNase H-like nuclease (RuvC/YqgF family)
MYEMTTYDSLEERIKTLRRQVDQKEEILSKIQHLENQIDFLRIELAEVEEDIKHSDNRLESLKATLRKEGVDDHNIAIFVRDAKIRAARGC